MATSDEIINLLRLLNTVGIGSVTCHRLIAEYGSAEAAVAALLHLGKPVQPLEQAQAEYDSCLAADIAIILADDDTYPQQLKTLNDYPPLLYAKGNISTLSFSRSVAIVGSRSASINGCKIAATIAHDLATQDVCIISGMARGIDSAAHLGALSSTKQFPTVAVLGTGIDVVYPPENTELYNQIAQNGCLISEYPLTTQGNSINFPRRNRLIAALSQAVLVVEAGLKSGSLITADYAMKLNKPLFAVPGTPDFSKASGSNHLIKKGAWLADCAQDILSHLTPAKPQVVPKFTQPRQKVLVFANNDVNFSTNQTTNSSLIDLLTIDGVDIDELVRLTGKPAAAIFAEISELEISGIVQRLSGNRVALIK